MRIKNEFNHTLIIEKSEFICYLKKCFTENESREFIQSIRKLHRDATHCCTAFVCGENNEIQRSNDDGEPSGTAGMPMLDALKKTNISNCCSCVVRYYGGIKLGAGGLIRAYSKSVSEAIRLAPKVEIQAMDIYSCTFAYELIGKMDFLLKDDCEILDKQYDILVTYIFQTPNKNISDKIQELTNGQYPCKFMENKLVEYDITS